MWKESLTSLVCAGVLLSASCGSTSSNDRRGNNSNAENPQAAVISVTTAKTESRDIAAVIQATGSVTADETSDVAPKTAGKIANLSVNAGQFVSGGAVIARVDDRDAKLQLASAQAALKRSKVSVAQAEARLGLGPNGKFTASNIPEVRAANANYEQTLAELKQAEANEKRYRELTESGDVAMMTYETYRTQRDTARTRANAARQQLEVTINTAKQSNQAIAAANADVESAMTQVADAQQAIVDTVIRAPFSGFVSNRPVAVGEYVSSASVVATILRTNPIKIQIQVAEADLPYVVLGRGVSVLIDAYKDRKFAGTVTSVNPAVDPVSRSAIVEASIENGDNALRPGMFATVRINKEGGGKGIFVPKAAVYNDQATQSYRVFVIVEGVAKLRVVQLGPEEGSSLQIMNGLNADEVVATSNLDQLYEGAKVAA
ncbi:MAG TPA: efflux RND transporter periplasmic adaptor subunit [Pyrinomonadaceae bacterium]|nr:efflux RND transporter periplasmic adaptor subunit [Acidobacteriota bacterium]HQZ95736.1 efflux RND transporter periplasmic adaptor subunit [Pyrinomonadaceae bacterium]